MKRIFLLQFFIPFMLSAQATDLTVFSAEADKFLFKYVKDGSVAYGKVRLQIQEAEVLYDQIGEMNIAELDDNKKKSFYINAYNIVVIYWVAKHYPIKSPMDITGFFDKVTHKVGREELTLNALEQKKLSQPYKDARFHFVLACAAKSCPPLAGFAYTPEKLERQLSERTTLALNDKDWIKLYPREKKIELSKIFDWYKGDFNGSVQSALGWINQYRIEKIPKTYAVGFYEYNWDLNELK